MQRFPSLASILGLPFLFGIFTFTMSSCRDHATHRQPSSETSQTLTTTSQDSIPPPSGSSQLYAAIYEGLLPCADCAGIKTTLKIAADYQSYVLLQEYQGKGVEPVQETGTLNTERGFGKDEDATLYILNDDKPVDQQHYFVRLSSDSTSVTMLDKDRKEIVSGLNYRLRKQ